jgi:hypothetical protein
VLYEQQSVILDENDGGSHALVHQCLR